MDNSTIYPQGITSGKPALKLKFVPGKKSRESLVSNHPRKLVLVNKAALESSTTPKNTNSASINHSNYVESQSSHHKRTKSESPAPGTPCDGLSQRSSLEMEEHANSAISRPPSAKVPLYRNAPQEPPQFLASPSTTPHRLYTSSGLQYNPIIPYASPEKSLPIDIETLLPTQTALSTSLASMIGSAPQASYLPKVFGTLDYAHAAPPGLAPVSFDPAFATPLVPDDLPRLSDSVGDYEGRACFLLSSAELLSHLRVLQRNTQIYTGLMPDLMKRGATLDGDWFKVRQDGMRLMTDLKDYCRWQMKQKHSKSTTYLETLKLTEEMFSYLQWMEKYRHNLISQHEVGCVGVVLSLLGQLCKAFELKE